MANFEAEYRCQLIPKEEVEFTDTTQTCQKIHTTIDKTFNAGFTREYSTFATNISYKESYTTTTSGVALSHATLFNTSTIINLMFIKILSAASTGTPDVIVTIGAETSGGLVLSGVGDGAVMPILGSTTQIKLLSSGATKLANIEIVICKGLIAGVDAVE